MRHVHQNMLAVVQSHGEPGKVSGGWALRYLAVVIELGEIYPEPERGADPACPKCGHKPGDPT